MQAEPELQWVRPPLQERSQQTLDRLLTAAEALIIEVGFEKATVAEIVRRAESSVGSFYTRFKDKEALLHCLVDRFIQEALATADSVLDPALWEECNSEELCRTLLGFMERMFTERRNLLRAVASRSTVEDADFSRFREAVIERVAVRLDALLRARGEEMGCDDPVRATRVVAWMCMHLFEGAGVQGPVNPMGLEREETLAEVAQMILRYLQIEGSASATHEGGNT